MAAGGKGIRAGAAFVEIFTDNSKLVRGLNAASKRLKSWGKSLTAMGSSALFGAAAAAAPLAFATNTFMQFEDQMKAVQAVTQSSGQAFDLLYEKAKLLGRTTSFTAAQVAEGMLNLARAGFNPQEIDAAIAGMLDLSRATGSDLAMATDIAAGTLRAFSLEADQSTRVADVLVATANNSAQTIEDLGESMKYVAPIAEEYGLSLEETAKALGVLANMQIKGSMAGTSMRMAMMKMADPNIRKQIEALGVATTDSTGNLRTDFGAMLLEIGDKAKGMTSGARIALFTDLFDARAAGAMAKLAKSDFPALGAAIDNAGGTAARTAETMDSGLGGGFRRLMSAVEGIQIAIGETLGKILTKLADYLSTVAEKIVSVVKANRGFIAAAVGVIAAVAGIGVGLVALGGVFSLLGFALGTVSTVLGVIGALLGALLSPIGMVAAAIVGGVVAWVKWSASGQQAWATAKQVFGSISSIAQQTFNGIADALGSGDLALAGRIAFLGLKTAAAQAMLGLRSIVGDSLAGLGGMLLSGDFTGAWEQAVRLMGSVWDGWSAGVVQVMVDVAKQLTSIWGKLTNWMTDKITDLSQTPFFRQAFYDLTGVDIKGEQERVNKQRAYTKQRTEESLAKFRAQREGATGPMAVQLDEQIAEAERLLERLGKPIDFAAGVKEETRAGTKGVESSINAILDEMAKTEQAQAERSKADAAQGTDAGLAALQAAAEAAGKDWEAALAEAATKKAEAEAAATAKAKEAVGGEDGPDAAAEKAVSVVGTFSAAAVRGFGGGGPMERVAKGVEKLVKTDEELLREVKLGAPAFS